MSLDERIYVSKHVNSLATELEDRLKAVEEWQMRREQRAIIEERQAERERLMSVYC